MSWKNLFNPFKGKKSNESVLEKEGQDSETRKTTHINEDIIKPLYPGYLTQYPDTEKDAEKEFLTIGLDFGTAFTKVLIGEHRVHYAVPFSDIPSVVDNYLLPGLFTISSDGHCRLGSSTEYAARFSDLKMKLLRGDFSDETILNTSTFLALIFQHSRSWLLNTKENTYAGKSIEWFVNIGVPTKNYYDKELGSAYQKIVELAWAASTLESPLTLERVKEIQNVFSDNTAINSEEITYETLQNSRIGLFPEFVAQIASYVRSPQRQPDIHLLVDVGAGTVDISTFNVHRDTDSEEDVFPIFAKDVVNLGTYFLQLFRRRESQYSGTWHPKSFDEIPNNHEMGEILSVSDKQLSDIDNKFGLNLRKIIIQQLKITKNDYYPESDRWKTGIPVFLCGGGSRVKLYRDTLIDIQDSQNSYPVIFSQLPLPSDMEAPGLQNEDFDRLSVAFGLSYGALDLGTIMDGTPEDDTASKTKTKKQCPVCRGTGGGYSNCSRCDGSGWV